MASKIYTLNFNNDAKTGLSLTLSTFKKVSDNSNVTPPSIAELGGGFYKFGLDLSLFDSDIYYVASDGGSNKLYGVLSQAGNQQLSDKIDLILGLCQENQSIDQTNYDGLGNLLTCRIRTYNNADSVGSDNDVIASYIMTATYSGTSMLSFMVAKQ